MKINGLVQTTVSIGIVILVIFISASSTVHSTNIITDQKDETLWHIPRDTTLYVDDDGGADYIHIQDAIDNASNGDIIRVWDGVYQENLTINKSVHIIGNSSATTTIIGVGDNSTVVSIETNDVELSSFTITNGSFIGIELLFCANVFISDNIITQNHYGIWLLMSSNNVIQDNTLVDNIEEGVSLSFSFLNQITQNNFINNSGQIGNAWFWNSLLNRWKQNYWDDLQGETIKKIDGQIDIGSIPIPWINIDWSPVQTPYDY